MANSVDTIIGSEAIKQVENLIAKLSVADAELIKISQSATTASKGISSISTPSALDKSVSSSNALNEKLKEQNEIINKLHADLAKRAEQSRLAEIRLQQQREKAFDSYEKSLQKENALNAKNETAYQRIQNSVNLLTKSYQDLAIRKQLGGNLTDKEEKQLVTLTDRINKYQTALKSVDADIQKNQRNVGNYASGFNGLGNSINQITRELPAFTFSAQTGFLALSNNIPILTDEIGKLVQKNKELKASGQETTSVFKQILGGVFSLQTLMGVAILAFTLYGKEISNFFSAIFKGNASISEFKLRIETLNKAFEDGALKNAVTDVNELRINIDLAKKGFLDKGKVVEQYNNTIGKTTGLVNSVDEAEKALVRNGDAYIKMMLYKAAANLALEEATKSMLEAEKSRRKSLDEFTNAFLDADLSQTRSKEQYEAKQRNLEVQRKKRQDEEVRINKETADKNINIAKKFQSDAAKIAESMDFNFFGDTKPEKVKKQKEARREDIQGLQSHIKTVGTLVSEINAEIARLQTEKIVANADELPAVNFQLEQLKTLKQQINGIPTVDFKINAPVKPEDVELVKEMTENVKSYLNSFSSEFMSNSGFSETFDLLNGNIEDFGENFAVTFNAIAESAQEAFNFISNASQQNFDQERARLQSQYENSLTYAEDGSVAQKKLAEDLEKRKIEIANRENKAKQKQAIFNIAIDTAQAVVASLKTDPTGILAIAIGALGAIQIGLVAAQKIPQYFEGTDNHKGGLMLVNDGKGANFQEKVILPNGKEIIPEGRNVLMNAPAGTKVLTHEQQIQQMLSERGISMNATYARSNGMTAEEMDSILSKHFSKIQTNVTNIDRKGITTWSEVNGQKTIRNNNRVNRTGYSV
jgi:archaellum component FlaC